LERIEAATASLDSGPPDLPLALDRARAYLLERRAVARIALELAVAREDDWLLHQARLAIKKWRYALECVDGVGVAEPDPRPALRQLQEVLGAFHDRAALIDAVERHRRTRDRPGFDALIAGLKAEKQEAFAKFRQLAPALGVERSARAPVRRGPRRAGQQPPVVAAPTSTDDRWERMAQWLLGKASEQ
jgi:CHAD domain-containing protein